MNDNQGRGVAEDAVFSRLIIFPVQPNPPHMGLQPGRKVHPGGAQHLMQVSKEGCGSTGERLDEFPILDDDKLEVLRVGAGRRITGYIDQFLQNLPGDLLLSKHPAASSGAKKGGQGFGGYAEVCWKIREIPWVPFFN